MAMFIQTEVTPNPATLKFLPHATVMSEGTQFYQDQSSAGNSILAQTLVVVLILIQVAQPLLYMMIVVLLVHLLMTQNLFNYQKQLLITIQIYLQQLLNILV